MLKNWKDQILSKQPKTDEILSELREQTATLLDKRAEAWIGENKLIHAGAARKLANELRGKLNGKA